MKKAVVPLISAEISLQSASDHRFLFNVDAVGVGHVADLLVASSIESDVELTFGMLQLTRPVAVVVGHVGKAVRSSHSQFFTVPFLSPNFFDLLDDG